MIIGQVEDKNPRTNNGFTPLHNAAGKGHFNIFKLIFDQVEDKNPANGSGQTWAMFYVIVIIKPYLKQFDGIFQYVLEVIKKKGSIYLMGCKTFGGLIKVYHEVLRRDFILSYFLCALCTL